MNIDPMTVAYKEQEVCPSKKRPHGTGPTEKPNFSTFPARGRTVGPSPSKPLSPKAGRFSNHEYGCNIRNCDSEFFAAALRKSTRSRFRRDADLRSAT